MSAAVILFDALNILILICSMHYAMRRHTRAMPFEIVGAGMIGIGAILELAKSMTAPHLVDPCETVVIAGVALYWIAQYIRKLMDKTNTNRKTKGDNYGR